MDESMDTWIDAWTGNSMKRKLIKVSETVKINIEIYVSVKSPSKVKR